MQRHHRELPLSTPCSRARRTCCSSYKSLDELVCFIGQPKSQRFISKSANCGSDCHKQRAYVCHPCGNQLWAVKHGRKISKPSWKSFFPLSRYVFLSQPEGTYASLPIAAAWDVIRKASGQRNWVCLPNARQQQEREIQRIWQLAEADPRPCFLHFWRPSNLAL